MAVPPKPRSNDQWLAELRGPRREAAIADLRLLLIRGLRAALHGGSSRSNPSIEDFAQEALIRILGNLDSFRGESRFTVWSQKIAIRVAFAEMRRLRWRDVSLEGAIQAHERPEPVDAAEDPEREATCNALMAQLRGFISEELTERQRTALLAAMGGMPMEVVAARMGSNRNAVYKLLHDARKRLKRRMEAEMLSPQDVFAAFAARQGISGPRHLDPKRDMFDRETFKAVIGDTREREKLGCDECFELLDRFVEAELSGLSAADAMPLVHEHLYLCGECRDEFNALLEALRATEGPATLTTEALDRLRQSVTPRYAR